MTERPRMQLTATVLESSDARELAGFYVRLLGWKVVQDEPDWVRLDHEDGGAALSFQTEPTYARPTWPATDGAQQMMVHLDINVDDLEVAGAHAEAAGATLANFQPQSDVRVYLDPAGHPFCLYRMRAQARARFADGDVVPEVAIGHEGRWGTSAIFGLPRPARDELAGLARGVAAVAGPGHWAHDMDSLHVTICTFEPYRPGVSPTDRQVVEFGAALRAAASGLPPVRLVLRGVGPHPRGVAALAYPEDDTADTLRRRIDRSLRAGSAPNRPGPSASRMDGDWYVNLVHFATPTVDVEAVLTWCDDHREAELGTVVLPVAELVRWEATCGTVRPVPLDRVELSAG